MSLENLVTSERRKFSENDEEKSKDKEDSFKQNPMTKYGKIRTLK